ncbi:hypothetical protein IWQ61_002850 [Dispira simplex]|nr:hypothetical protein IWQ61_002850 [Dispira simplex]
MDPSRGLEAFERLVKSSDAAEALKRGTCRKCGGAGHLTFECRNFIELPPKPSFLAAATTADTSPRDNIGKAGKSSRKTTTIAEYRNRSKHSRSKKPRRSYHRRSRSPSISSSGSSTDSSRVSSRSSSRSYRRSTRRRHSHTRHHRHKTSRKSRSRHHRDTDSSSSESSATDSETTDCTSRSTSPVRRHRDHPEREHRLRLGDHSYDRRTHKSSYRSES